MRLLLLCCLLFAVACGPSKNVKIEGEVYVVTEGRETVKLAGSDVSVYRLEDVEKMVDDHKSDVYDHLMQLPRESFETVTTDSEGRFSFTLPPGEYAVFSLQTRQAGSRREAYHWLVKAQPKTTLSNNNLAGRGDSLLPRRFALP